MENKFGGHDCECSFVGLGAKLLFDAILLDDGIKVLEGCGQ